MAKTASSSGELLDIWKQESGETLVAYRQDFYRWDFGRYHRVEREWVRNSVWRTIKDYSNAQGASIDLSPVMIGQIVDLLADQVFIKGDQSPPFYFGVGDCFVGAGKGAEHVANVLVLGNGVLDVETGELSEHNPTLFVVGGADYNFDPQAQCPQWLKFLDWFAAGDQGVVDLLGQYLAWSLLPDHQLQHFLWLSGAGDNGKGVLALVVGYLFGESNIARIPMERFGHRFALAEMVGKRVNIVADCEETDKIQEGLLKQISAGDPISVEKKFKDVFATPMSARLIFLSNALPRFRDKSNGIWRRLIIVPCRAVVAQEQRVINFEQELYAEAPGILNWVLGFVDRLRKNRRLTIPPICQQASGNHRAESNPVRLFCEQQLECSEAPTDFIITDSIYERFKKWAGDSGYVHPVSSPVFSKELVAFFGTHAIKRSRQSCVGGRYWAYVGLRWRDEGEIARQVEDGVVEIKVSPTPTPQSLLKLESREHKELAVLRQKLDFTQQKHDTMQKKLAQRDRKIEHYQARLESQMLGDRLALRASFLEWNQGKPPYESKDGDQKTKDFLKHYKGPLDREDADTELFKWLLEGLADGVPKDLTGATAEATTAS